MGLNSYRMEQATREEMSAEDPFSGHGFFLESLATDGDSVLAELGQAFGSVLPAVAWPGHGVWIDMRSTGMSAAETLAHWARSRALSGPGR